MEVDSKYMDFIATVLRGIERELERLYWNQNQKELESPFCNTGNKYSNSTFSVSAYDWNAEGLGDDNEEVEMPANFSYKGFQLYWYKYLGRGMYAICDVPVDAEYLYQMYEDCIKALNIDII